MEHLRTAQPTSPGLRWGDLQLRPIDEQDLPFLYQWRTDAQHCYLWTTHRELPTYPVFVEQLVDVSRHDREIHPVVTLRDCLIGEVFTYDRSSADGYAFVSAYLVPEFRGRGYGVKATLLLARYAFAYHDLHKLYFDVFSYNSASLAALRGTCLVEEGHFREHRYFDGTRWDVHRFALYRDKWQQVRHHFRL